MNMFEALPKQLQLVIILSPYFITVITLAIFIKKYRSKVINTSLYWLASSIIFLVLWTWAILEKSSSFSEIMLLGIYLTNAIASYKALKSKDR